MVEADCFITHKTNVLSTQRGEQVLQEDEISKLIISNCKSSPPTRENLLRFEGCKDPDINRRRYRKHESNLCEKEVERDLRASGSDSDGKELMVVASQSENGVSVHNMGKVMLLSGEFQELYVRLQNLEEDNGSMMKEVFTSVQERRELMSEVSEILQIVYNHQRSTVTGEKSSEDGSTENGLSQVLRADSTPSFVTRVLKANTLSFQDSLTSNVRILK